MVQDGYHLVVHCFQVGVGIGTLFFIPVGQQFILPGDDVFCSDLTDDAFSKGRNQFVLNNIGLGLPGAFFQPGPAIPFVQLAECSECHIHVCGILLKEYPFPFLGIFLGLKTPLALLPPFSFPIVVPCQRIPLSALFILVYRHCPSLLSMPDTASPENNPD